MDTNYSFNDDSSSMKMMIIYQLFPVDSSRDNILKIKNELKRITVPDNILPALRKYYRWLKYNNGGWGSTGGMTVTDGSNNGGWGSTGGVNKVNGTNGSNNGGWGGMTGTDGTDGSNNNGIEPDFLQSKYFDFNTNEYKYNLLYYHHNLILQALRQKAKGQNIDNHQNLEEIEYIISAPMSLSTIIDFIKKYYQPMDNYYTRILLVNKGIYGFRDDTDYLINKQIRDSLLRNIGYCHITNDGIKVIRDFIFKNSTSFECISIASGLGFVEYCLENYQDEHTQKLMIHCYDMLIGFNDEDGVNANGWKYPIIEDLSSDLRTDSIDYDVLFLSWPPEYKSVAYNSIRRFTGNIVIYIGEYHEVNVDHSCTANEGFHQYLEQYFSLEAKLSGTRFLYNMQIFGAVTYSSINLFIKNPLTNN